MKETCKKVGERQVRTAATRPEDPNQWGSLLPPKDVTPPHLPWFTSAPSVLASLNTTISSKASLHEALQATAAWPLPSTCRVAVYTHVVLYEGRQSRGHQTRHPAPNRWGCPQFLQIGRAKSPQENVGKAIGKRL